MTTRFFYTADVFTSTRFGGNQLAVIPDATGLSDAQMLAITREFDPNCLPLVRKFSSTRSRTRGRR